MIEIEHFPDRGHVLIRASGRLSRADFDRVIPEVENAIALAGAPLRVILRLEDFQGWDLAALWRGFEFDLAHDGDFGRVAILGETGAEKWGVALAAPFARAEVRYFPIEREDEAWAWLDRADDHS
jgi:hypothetical protein